MRRHHRFPHLCSTPITRLGAILAMFAVLGLGACGSDGSDAGSPVTTRPSIAGVWQLESVTVDNAAVEIPSGASTEMRIDAGQVTAQGGCNSASGQIDAGDDGSLGFIDLAQTEMGCEHLGFEAVYLPALAGSTQWLVDPTGLTLTGPNSQLTYTTGPAAVQLPLSATLWRFDTIFAGTGVARSAATPNMTLPSVELVITDGQAKLTSADCDPISLGIKTEGETDGPFMVESAIPAGPPDCETPESNMIAAFDGLMASTGFMIDESRLTFIGLPGETVGFTGGG